MALGTLLMTIQDATSKWLISDYSVGEILFYRGIWAYLPIAWFVWRGGGLKLLRSRRPFANVVRSVLNTVAGLAVISAYAYMPLATAMAIMFSSPLLVAALSGPVLSEHVGVVRWLAVIAGFCGVLLVLNPFGGGLTWIYLLPLIAAVFIALRDMMTRHLGAFDDPSVILFYTVTLSVITGGVWMAVFGARWPDERGWMIFIVMGLVNGCAHYCVIKALSIAHAASVMPLRYLSLLWACIIGFVVWNDVPSAVAASGMCLIVASGIAILFRESRTKQAVSNKPR